MFVLLALTGVARSIGGICTSCNVVTLEPNLRAALSGTDDSFERVRESGTNNEDRRLEGGVAMKSRAETSELAWPSADFEQPTMEKWVYSSVLRFQPVCPPPSLVTKAAGKQV
eukprot:CAMPEP_0172776120 /NCGR_PEP_ID=MMETSP1074-20121228/199258_1 /TAXON_ID=2916 /ORGANISM="Ceratium fusus, Strain PA161109" /LENGTH=112 /DNA_ID=CAMNT_0013612847 /DNA_START=142 /DNA_END=481 /DNA_ORIENTATION=+